MRRCIHGHAQLALTDGTGSAKAFAMQPGSPRFPCIHSMHGVGCRLPENEPLTAWTLSPRGISLHMYTHDHTRRTAARWPAAPSDAHVQSHKCRIRTGIHEMDACVRWDNGGNCPPKHPFVFVSWSDLPVCTNRLYQPAFGFWPDVLPPFFLLWIVQNREFLCGC